MKILNISDTHGLHSKIDDLSMVEADVLIHGGDCTNEGELYGLGGLEHFLTWFDKLEGYKYKIFIAGNHDWCFERYPQDCNEMLADFPDIIYLQDESVILDGVKFYGSPQSPYFFNWAFNCARNEDEKSNYNKPLIRPFWEMIDEDTDVLITHGPAYGIGDLITGYGLPQHVGCEDLLDIIVTKLRIKAHIFGHIHCAYGQVNKHHTQFVNASICTEGYRPTNKPIYIEV